MLTVALILLIAAPATAAPRLAEIREPSFLQVIVARLAAWLTGTPPYKGPTSAWENLGAEPDPNGLLTKPPSAPAEATQTTSNTTSG